MRSLRNTNPKPESAVEGPAIYKESPIDSAVVLAMYFGPSLVLSALGAYAGKQVSEKFPSIVGKKTAIALGAAAGALAGAVAVVNTEAAAQEDHLKRSYS